MKRNPPIAVPAPCIEFRLWQQISGGKNHVGITRYGRRYPLKAFVAWRDQAALEIKFVSRIPPGMLPLRGPLTMHMDYRPQDKRTRNMDNLLSALFHLMEYTGLIEDDDQIENLIWYKRQVLPCCAIVRLERCGGVDHES